MMSLRLVTSGRPAPHPRQPHAMHPEPVLVRLGDGADAIAILRLRQTTAAQSVQDDYIYDWHTFDVEKSPEGKPRRSGAQSGVLLETRRRAHAAIFTIQPAGSAILRRARDVRRCDVELHEWLVVPAA